MRPSAHSEKVLKSAPVGVPKTESSMKPESEIEDQRNKSSATFALYLFACLLHPHPDTKERPKDSSIAICVSEPCDKTHHLNASKCVVTKDCDSAISRSTDEPRSASMATQKQGTGTSFEESR